MQRLQLPASLDIANTEFAELVRQLSFGDELVIDASGVTRIDASGAQLIVAIVASARTSGARIRWDQPAVVVVDAARTLGLAAWFGLVSEQA